jgi:FKBP-type peptidyl-prolyl cis-trans isomerase FklB
MKKLFFGALILTCTATMAQKSTTTKKVTATKSVAATTTPLKNLKDSASYALGVNIAKNLKAQNLDKIDVSLVTKGMNDVFGNKPLSITEMQSMQCVNTYVQAQNAQKSMPEKAAGKKFLAENAKRKGVISMPGGWQYEVLRASESTVHPLPTDKVKVHYHGTLTDGTVFDSSVDRGEPIAFGLNQVIKGWTLAVTQMTVGSKWKIFLPSDLAYGDNGSGDKIKPGATLIFEVELLDIEKE